jgi:antitoxin component YwqK of YwqJK toxin-antitoxin module
MKIPLLFALMAMVVISAIAQKEENASVRPIILDEIEASIEVRKSLVRYYKWTDFKYANNAEAKFWNDIPDWSGVTKEIPVANSAPENKKEPSSGFFSIFKRRPAYTQPVKVETRQVKAGAFDIPLTRRDMNGSIVLEENATGYTGFSKYKFFAFRTLYEVKNGWVERMKTWYPDGQQKEDYNFRKGRKHGPYQHWYENGQLEKFGNNRDGEPDGPFSMWYKDGQKWIEQTYINGNRNGYSVFYNQDGTERKRTAHHNGKFILLENWSGTQEDAVKAFRMVDENGSRLRFLRYGIYPFSGNIEITDANGNTIKKTAFLQGKVHKQ